MYIYYIDAETEMLQDGGRGESLRLECQQLLKHSDSLYCYNPRERGTDAGRVEFITPTFHFSAPEASLRALGCKRHKSRGQKNQSEME